MRCRHKSLRAEEACANAKTEEERQQKINIADGKRQAAILNSEGEKQGAINRAEGEATATRLIAEANAAAVTAVGQAMGSKGGMEAANLKVAQQYVEAFSQLAKTSNTLIVPGECKRHRGIFGDGNDGVGPC